MLATVTMASLVLSAFMIFGLRRAPLLRNSSLLVYTVWHLPLVITLTFPFTTPFHRAADIQYIAGLLIATHVVIIGGVCAYVMSSSKRPDCLPKLTPSGTHLIIAYLAPLFLFIEFFLMRGVSFSLDLAGNREAFAGGPVTVFGQFGGLLAGFSLYVALFAPVAGREMFVRLRLKYAAPFLLTAGIYLISGNRQFLLLGTLLIALAFIYVYQPSLKALVWKGGVCVLAFAVVMISFGMVRAAATEGVQDQALQNTLLIEIDDHDNPLIRNYFTRTALLYVYGYYGIEYQLSATIADRMVPEAPLGSMTAPVIYRRYSGFLDLPAQDEVRATIDNTLISSFGIYPKVWSTMYTQVFYELGVVGIAVFALLLAVLHFVFTFRYLQWGSPYSLLIFYCFVLFGIQYIATGEVTFWGLILAASLNTLGLKVVWNTPTASAISRRGHNRA